MNIKIIIAAASGLVIGAVSAYVLTKKIFTKKLQAEADACNKAMKEAQKELKEVKRIFVDSQPPEIAGERAKKWKDIVKNDINKVADPSPETEVTVSEPATDEPKNKTSESEWTDYSSISKKYGSEEEKPKPPETAYPITKDEFNKAARDEHLAVLVWYYNLNTDELVDDFEEPVEDIFGYLGITDTALKDMVAADEGQTGELYFKNPARYQVYRIDIVM